MPRSNPAMTRRLPRLHRGAARACRDGRLRQPTIAFDQIDESGGQYGFDHNVPLDLADQARMHTRLREVYREDPVDGSIQNGGKEPLVDLADLMPRRDLQRTDSSPPFPTTTTRMPT